MTGHTGGPVRVAKRATERSRQLLGRSPACQGSARSEPMQH